MYSESRIKEKINNETGIDVDWYLVDNAGRIAIISSAGGLLPDTVAIDLKRQRTLQNYFRSLPEISDEIIISEETLLQIKLFDENRKSSYLKDLYFMCKKGLYYYDKLVLNQYYDFRYYLKSMPAKPLTITHIENAIAEILVATRVDESFQRLKLVNVYEIL